MSVHLQSANRYIQGEFNSPDQIGRKREGMAVVKIKRNAIPDLPFQESISYRRTRGTFQDRVANLGNFSPKNANLGIFWPSGN
jgi:hypothetical protein